ncbi:MAG: hypothetical protein RID53_09145 [Coleofasciculus sp. B1-GNL1-01]|uniref:hypothetical protein n=1 Tax=Coleofasciculus sp. B1-GNL1-01 TaxID=3068484 RepID=UPI003303F0FB
MQSEEQQWVQEFVEHATEHLYRIEQDLLQLSGSKDIELVYGLCRAVLSIQAQAEMLGLDSIDRLANRWHEQLERLSLVWILFAQNLRKLVALFRQLLYPEKEQRLKLFIQTPLANPTLMRNNAGANSNHPRDCDDCIFIHN